MSSTYASGSVRVPGLSGNDTDFVSMIKQLKEIESRQVNQLLRWKKDWQTRLDAFKELRGELMNLQSTLKSMNSMSTFLAKATVSSNDKVATAVADGDAMNVSYFVEVNRKATNATWTTSLPLYNKTDVISENGGVFEYSYKGEIRTLNVPKGTTVEGLVKLINNDSKNKGVKAQLIQSADGLAFQLRGMDTGQTNSLVIRKTENLTGLDVSLSASNYDEEDPHRVKYLTGFDSLGDVINSTGVEKTFVYTLDGNRRSIALEDGATVQDLIDKINAIDPGLAKTEADGAGKSYLVLEKDQTTYAFNNYPDGDTGLDDILALSFGAETETVVSTGQQGYQFQFSVESSDGSNPYYTIEVTPEMTFRGLANAIQEKIGGTGTAKIISAGGSPEQFKIQIEQTPKDHRVTVENGSLESMSYVPPTSEGWDVVHAVNAQVRINGYPSGEDQWMEVASNTLKSGEVIPGVTFTLHSTGETDISVSTDTEKIQESIEEFVEAVNSFRTKLMELTKYDESKETVDLDYAESQFETQKGGILQGNYGVQMVASRLKSAIAAAGIGFTARNASNVDSGMRLGDLFTTLSQIGITTNADTGSSNYGLLEINYIDNHKGSKSLTQALAEDPEAVAKLFALESEGISNTDDVHYNSHLAGITQAGTHTISYKTDANGDITEAFINGQAAKFDNDNYTITATEGSARGLVVDVANRDPNTTVTNASVSIKTGKINELVSMLDGSEGMLGTNGTLQTLERNYQKIIDGIDDKIKREDDRLARWENTMVLKFARLEQVLANYSGLQKTLESQLSQLSNNNSK